jgi:hypothetical protein
MGLGWNISGVDDLRGRVGVGVGLWVGVGLFLGVGVVILG